MAQAAAYLVHGEGVRLKQGAFSWEGLAAAGGFRPIPRQGFQDPREFISEWSASPASPSACRAAHRIALADGDSPRNQLTRGTYLLLVVSLLPPLARTIFSPHATRLEKRFGPPFGCLHEKQLQLRLVAQCRKLLAHLQEGCGVDCCLPGSVHSFHRVSSTPIPRTSRRRDRIFSRRANNSHLPSTRIPLNSPRESIPR